MSYLPDPVNREDYYLYAIAKNEEEVQKQALLTQYVAAMAGVYIPEEDENVQDSITTETILPERSVDKDGGTSKAEKETDR